MESKPFWKKTSSEGRQQWCVIGIALILILAVVAVWPWLRIALWSHQEIALYFSKPQGLYLGSEKRRFTERTPVAYQVTAALIGGPQSDKLTNSIPKGTKLLSLRLLRDVAYVDLSEEFSTNIVDKRQEVLALYSIVNTLTSLPGVERVQILIAGRRRDTLHGNISIRNPLEADHSLIVGAGD
jgi:germination protein M